MSTDKQKIKHLQEYKELNDLVSHAKKRIEEIKAEIKEKYKPGEYGELLLTIEERRVKEYIVPARIDKVIKVVKK